MTRRPSLSLCVCSTGVITVPLIILFAKSFLPNLITTMASIIHRHHHRSKHLSNAYHGSGFALRVYVINSAPAFKHPKRSIPRGSWDTERLGDLPGRAVRWSYSHFTLPPSGARSSTPGASWPQHGGVLTLRRAETLPLAGSTGGPSGKGTSHFSAEVNNKPGFLELDQLLAHARPFVTRGQSERWSHPLGTTAPGRGRWGTRLHSSQRLYCPKNMCLAAGGKCQFKGNNKRRGKRADVHSPIIYL